MKYTQEDSAAWWLADKFDRDPYTIAIPHIQKLKSSQAGRYDNMQRLISAYEKGPRNANRDQGDEPPLVDDVVTFNHARNGVDTVHAKLCKPRILPMCMTQGGGALERERARNQEKAIHGELRKNKLEEMMEDIIRDGLVTGIGWAHVLHGRPSLTIDWVPSDDVLIDVAEARTRRPRTIFRRVPLDRYVVLDRYGEKSDAFYGKAANRIAKIRKCKTTGELATGQRDLLGNQLDVWLAFHLRSDAEDPNDDEDFEHDGKFGVFIDGCTLEFAPWDRTMLPFMPHVPFPRMRQLHGLSLMADFLSPQKEHDKISDRIQRSAHRMGGTHILAPREANLDSRELNNGQGTVIDYDAGQVGPGAIVELNPSIANPQTFEYRKGLIDEMYASKGINAMAATGGAPDGLQGASGKALQVAEEESAERLLIPYRKTERFVVGLSWLVVEEARAMVETNASYSVKFKGERRGLQKVEWKKVLMDHDEFDLDVFPTNALAKSPSAKFAQLTELLKANAITTEQFRRLFELPDLEAENEVDLADIEIIDKVMDEIVIEGRALQPEAFDYLDLIVQRGRKYYNMCRKKKVPEDRLALLRDYVSRAKAMNDKQKQDAAMALQAQAMAAAPAPPPQGAPAPGAPPPQQQPPRAA